MTNDPARFAVVGNPIAHSKSPQIHQHFAEQFGIALHYDRALVAPDAQAFWDWVRQFFKEGGHGLNVTVPFKEIAFQGADVLTDVADAAGAVNTLYQDECSQQLVGDNTDGRGLVYDLTQRLQWTLTGKRVLLLGAGGAARGVILPLMKEQPSDLVVWNRTSEKASTLVEQFRVRFPTQSQSVELRVADDKPDDPAPFDVIINATSSGLSNSVPAISSHWIAAHSEVYDMLYANEPTPFITYAHKQGCKRTADGLGMLVGQAAFSFEVWHKRFPDMEKTMRFMSTLS